MLLAVQRLRLPGPGVVSYTLVGTDGLPVEPAEAFLSHLTLTAAPNTVQAYAHDLQDFFTWLGQTSLDWHSLSLEQLALFFDWLRRPAAARAPGVFMLPGTAAALENSTLQRKRAALAGFYRFHARRDNRVPALLGELIGTRPTGQYTPMLVHTRRAGPAGYSPIRIHAHRKVSETLTAEEVGQVLEACTTLRDKFLVVLLNESGLRISEALGLRHADLNLRAGEVAVVPREDNDNEARVKQMKGRVVPVRGEVLDLYADYMELEYGSLDCDYVFVNLFRGPAGTPMTRWCVSKLVERLRARTGIGHLHPHVFRHSYATRLLRAGMPVEVVAELLGHSSSQTTAETYGHLTAEDHRRFLVSAGLVEDRAAGG